MKEIQKIIYDMINCEVHYLAEAFKCNIALSPKNSFEYSDIVEILNITLKRAGYVKENN